MQESLTTEMQQPRGVQSWIPAKARIPRIGLRWFLLAVALLPLAIGMYVRWEMTRTAGYYAFQREINSRLPLAPGFGNHRVSAAWRTNGFGKEELIYLVVMPPGPHSYSSCGNGFYRTRRDLLVGPRGDQLVIECYQAYCDGRRLSNDETPTVWLYLPSAHLLDNQPDQPRPSHVAELSKIPSSELNLTREQFADLENSRLWKDYLEPAALAEYQKYDSQFRSRP